MRKKEFRAVRDYDLGQTLELRAEKGQPTKLSGYAAIFNKLSVPTWGFQEKIEPGAFTKTIKRDDVRALVEHDPARIVGRNVAGTLRLAEDDVGLKVSVDLPDTNTGRDVAVSIERGDLSQMSFGFYVVSQRWETKDKADIRTIEEVELFDVSVVAFPAYEETSVALRSLEEYHKRVSLSVRRRRLQLACLSY
jgi:hypothetical protein